MIRASLALLAVVLAGCSRGDDVEVGPGGELLMGTHRASATETRGVLLDGRRLVLDGFAGTIRVVGGPAGGPARLTFERVARGRTEANAERLLRNVTVAESGDATTYTFRMTAANREGAEVNVDAVVPRDADLEIRLAGGAVQVDTLDGDLQVTLDAGPVRATSLAGRSVRVDAQAGAMAVDAASLPADADWELRTRAGSVALGLPPAASVRVDAETGTGTIRVQGLDFTERRLDRRGTGMRFAGTLGEGGGRVRAGTEVGSVRLRSVGGVGGGE